MNEEKNINEIKEKYQEIYGEDVKVEYDEETGEYIILDENGNEIDRTSSLSEEIEKLDAIENYYKNNNDSSNYVGSYVSSSGPSQENQRSESRGMIGLSLDSVKIDLNFSDIYVAIDKLDSMVSIPLNCDTSYASCLSGELATYYNGLNDTTKEDLSKLSNMIESLMMVTSSSVEMLKENNQYSYEDLSALIDILYNEYDSISNSDEYSAMTLERKKEYLNNMIKYAKMCLSSINDEYKNLYGDTVKVWLPILYSTGLIDQKTADIINDNIANNGVIDYDSLKKIVTLCEEKDFFGKVERFVNNGSFKDTFATLYLEEGENIEDLEEFELKELENSFMRDFSILTNTFDYNIDINDFRSNFKNYLEKNNLISFSNDKVVMNNEMLLDNEHISIAKYETYCNDIANLKYYIQELNTELKLADYNIDKENSEYEKYLLKDYSDDEIDKIIRNFYSPGYFFDPSNPDSVIFSQEQQTREFYSLIPYLSHDEMALFNYYIDDKDYNKAYNYLTALKDHLNQRKGFSDACDSLKDGGVTVFEGLFDGIQNWYSNVLNVSKLGMDPISDSQYKSMFISTLLNAAKNPIGDRGEYEEFLKNISPDSAFVNDISYKVSSQIGNMLVPSIIGLSIGALTGGAGFTIAGHSFSWASLAGSTAVGLGAAGSSMAQAYSRGEENQLKILAYGILNGLSETAFTMLLSKIPGLGNTQGESSSKFWQLLSNNFGEAKEEFIQAFVGNGLDSIFFGDEFNFGKTLEEANISAFYGFLTSAVMSGGKVSFNIVVDGAKQIVSGSPTKIMQLFNEVNGDLRLLKERLKMGALLPLGLSITTVGSGSTTSSHVGTNLDLDAIGNELNLIITDNHNGTYTIMDNNLNETTVNEHDFSEIYLKKLLQNQPTNRRGCKKIPDSYLNAYNLEIGNDEAIWYDTVNDRYYIGKKATSSIYLRGINQDFIEHPNTNVDSRVNAITYIDGFKYYQDSITGLSWKGDTDFTNPTDINHVHVGNASGGGHDICAMLGIPSGGVVDVSINSQGKQVLKSLDGKTEIVIENRDSGSGVCQCTVRRQGRPPERGKTMFPVDIINTSSTTAQVMPSSTFGNIDNAVVTVGDADPKAFILETQKTGNTILKIAYEEIHNGVTCMVIKDKDGRPITSYPIYPGESFDYESEGWTMLK